MWEKFINLTLKAPLLLLASISVLLPIIVGFYRKKYLSSELKILLFYLIIYSIFDLSEWLYVLLGKKNNMYLHNISEWISMLITGILYFKILDTTLKKNIVLALIFIIIIQNLLQFNWAELAGYSFTLNKLILIFFVFLHFQSIITELNISNILLHPPFWISAAFMIFSCGTLFIYLFWNYTLSTTIQNSIFRVYDNFEQIFRILFMLLFSIAFWVSKFEKKHV
jgi:hypothetical protein